MKDAQQWEELDVIKYFLGFDVTLYSCFANRAKYPEMTIESLLIWKKLHDDLIKST